MTAPEVVITGLGATTPLGGDVPSTWAAALAGESGARTFDNDWAATYELPVTFAAQLRVHPSEVLSRPEMKRMDPSFSEKSLGFKSFSDFLRSRTDVVELDESSTTRMVRLRGDA